MVKKFKKSIGIVFLAMVVVFLGGVPAYASEVES